MTAPDPGEESAAEKVDGVASRVRLWVSAAILVGTVVSAVTAISVRWATSDVRRDVAETRLVLDRYAEVQHIRYDVDSVRFNRVMEVVELAVVAIVEPAGSEDQRAAVLSLRSRRRVVPAVH